MRSCCEKTLGVLRENKESLITIIEVKPFCATQMLMLVRGSVMVTTVPPLVCCHLPCCFLLLILGQTFSCCIA